MIPVICTVNFEPDLINEFLVKTYAAEPGAPETLCVITTKDWSSYHNEARLDPEEARKQKQVVLPRGGGPMETPSRPPWTTQFETPFKHQAPEDIAEILQNAEDILPEMSKKYCIILDERTSKDKTVLLVKTSRGPESNLPRNNQSPIVQCRSSFEDANSIIQAVCVGVGSLEELVWNENPANR